MTIGPDPMTRTLWISVRLGIGGVPVTDPGDGSSPAPGPGANSQASCCSIAPHGVRAATPRCLSPTRCGHGHLDEIVPGHDTVGRLDRNAGARDARDRRDMPVDVHAGIDREVR